MACLSAVCSNGFLVCQDNFEFYAAKTKSLDKFRVFCCSSFPSKRFYNFGKPLKGLFWDGKFKSLVLDNVGISSIRFSSSCSSHPGLSRNDDIKPLRSGKSGPKQLHVGKIKNSKFKRRFSLRFRPRLWLLISRMKRASVKCLLNDIGAFVQKNLRNLTLSATISVALGLSYLFLKVTALPSPKAVPYSDLVTSLQNGSVSKVLLEEGSRCIYYNVNVQSGENIEMSDKESLAVSSSFVNVDDKVASGSESGLGSSKSSNFNVFNKFSKAQVSTPKWQYCTRKIDHDEKFLLSLMRNKGTIYSSAPQSVLMSMRNTLITIMTLWIPLLPLMWLLYRQLSAANSPARKRRPNTEVVGFDDVEGVDAAKVELLEIVLCMQGAISYQKLGAKLPRGVLLVGPPGTGKTLLARAVAGEAGVPFLTVSASEFVEMFVGRGAARIRDLFKAARKCAPSIIFIDELDAVGGKRGRSLNDERDQTLNQLLTEMDGFESDTRVIVIAATNRPEALDSALCRPGRFSRKVLVGEPDEEGRRKILAVHLRGVPLEEDMHLICNLVASLTQGFVGADLANIVNEAALLAARKGGETVTREDIMEAIERAKFGIVDKQLRPSTLSKELGKLFPWIPSLIGKNEARQEGLQGPLGYQTLS